MSIPSSETEPVTLASTVYEQLRRDIVSVRLAPGGKLGVDALRARYGVGGSPVREALNRLSAEGLVWQRDQKGFRVAPVSGEELVELTRTRGWINAIALRDAIAHGDAAWEEASVLAFHRLSRVATRLDDNGINPEWERLHRAFHAALISACRSRWILDFAEMLFDCADRYRHLSAAVTPPESRDVAGEHRTILQAAIDRDADQAIALLDAHVGRTADTVRIARFGATPESTPMGARRSDAG